jgi:hypothetical protein
MAKKAKGKSNVLGAWAFLIGVVLAVIAGFVPTIELTQGIWAGVFVALGIIIGLLNITAQEVKDFMLAGTVLIVVSSLSGFAYRALPYVGDIIRALVVLFTPATIVVALKVVFTEARN